MKTKKCRNLKSSKNRTRRRKLQSKQDWLLKLSNNRIINILQRMVISDKVWISSQEYYLLSKRIFRSDRVTTILKLMEMGYKDKKARV